MFNKIFNVFGKKSDATTQPNIDLSLGYNRLDEFKNYLQNCEFQKFEDEYELLTWDAKTLLNEGIGLNENNASLIEKWVNEMPDSYIAHLFSGVSKTCLAWIARTAANGNLVSNERAEKFTELLEDAHKHLCKADELNPNDAEICARMIRVCMGLGAEKSVTESYFEAAVDLNPNHLMSYLMMINYLNPKWYGSLEEMNDFANRQVDSHNNSSLLVTLKLFAAAEEWLYYNMNGEKQKQKEFLTNGELQKKIQNLYSQYNEENDGSLLIPYVYNYFAFLFYKLDDKMKTKELITKIDGRMTVYPWAYVNVTSSNQLQNLI